jgi:purine-cytosine permease-like protein
MKTESTNQLQKLVKLFTTFKTHLSIFIIANAVLWAVWLLTDTTSIYSVPLYISFAWSVILLVHYFIAYRKFRKNRTV